jgi:hypothetical protein
MKNLSDEGFIIFLPYHFGLIHDFDQDMWVYNHDRIKGQFIHINDSYIGDELRKKKENEKINEKGR